MNNWIHITAEKDVENIVKLSHEKAQIIFKDSKSCGISSYAKSRLVDGNTLLENKADFNYLDLLAYRSVSNFIASHLNVIHQSPQIIILKDGNVTFTSSHHKIDAKNILSEL